MDEARRVWWGDCFAWTGGVALLLGFAAVKVGLHRHAPALFLLAVCGLILGPKLSRVSSRTSADDSAIGGCDHGGDCGGGD